MDKIKWLAILLLFSVTLLPAIFNVSAQSTSLGQFQNIQTPSQTELVSKKDETTKTIHGVYYKYLSELSSEEIIQFYRNIFTFEEGVTEKEQRKSGKRTTLNFVYGDGTIMRAVLTVFEKYPNDYGEEVRGRSAYYLSIFENQDVLGLSAFKPEPPKKLNFAPVYQAAEQFCFFDKLPHWKVATYLAKADAEEIAVFYRKEMLGFKWQFVSAHPYEGQFNLLDAFTMGDANSKDKIKGEEKWPGIDLNLKKIVLTFTNDAKNQECVIHIIQFNDPPEVLKEKHIDPLPLEKYGNTFINLIVYNKDKEEQ